MIGGKDYLNLLILQCEYYIDKFDLIETIDSLQQQTLKQNKFT